VRALKAGQVADFAVEAMAHPEAIHEKFTATMHRWELEWETLKW
jgi:hypothetical protein